MIPLSIEDQLQIMTGRDQNELFAWYQKAYPVIKRKCDIGWAEARRMRRARDFWQVVAAAEATVIVVWLVLMAMERR